MPVRAVLYSILATFCCLCSLAQTCPTGIQSDKLICLLPQIYGVDGLAAAVRFGDVGTFSTDFLVEQLTPLESSIARQSALLPLASPSSGLTYSWDPSARVFVSSTDSFGPIFGERAETIGRHKLSVGFSYQYFKFDRIDGISLSKLPVALFQADDSTTYKGDKLTCSAKSNTEITAPGNVNQVYVSSFDNVGNGSDNCGFIRDVIDTTNQIDLKVHQNTTFVTYGLTNKIDLSVAFPVEYIQMAISSHGSIIYNDDRNGFHFYAFDPTRPDCVSHLPCYDSTFMNSGTASGIGDITLRVKGMGWKGERAALGWGADLRLPTGDEENFLGVGAVGVRPFAVWSYAARVSPHALFGYQANGSSVIGGDLTTGHTGRIPDAITYSGGADVWLTKRITAAFDLVGQQVPRAEVVSNDQVPDLGKCDPNNCFSPSNGGTITPSTKPHDTLKITTKSYNVTDGSAGVKIRPGANLLIIGNALFKLNEGGLRASTVPMVGVSYTF